MKPGVLCDHPAGPELVELFHRLDFPTRRRAEARSRRLARALAATLALTLSAGLGMQGMTATAAVTPVGAGFTVNAADLAFILKQIKISEAHVANTTSATGPCGALLGLGAEPGSERSHLLRPPHRRRLVQQPHSRAAPPSAPPTSSSRGSPHPRSATPRPLPQASPRQAPRATRRSPASCTTASRA